MATNNGPEAEQLEVQLRRLKSARVQLGSNSFILSWAQADEPQPSLPRYILSRVTLHVDEDLLRHLSTFPSPGKHFSTAQIGSWLLFQQTGGVQREGVIAPAQRVVVEDELVQPGKKHSGIFKIISTFRGPDNIVWKMQGTAFAIGKFFALTPGHIMWHPKLGPAETAVLYPDERSASNVQSIACIAVAVHAEWMKSYRHENDFCMVTTKDDFNAGVHCLQLGELPQVSPYEGEVIGFPLDLPTASKGTQLIQCQGSAEGYRTEGGGDIIRHEVNTSGGSSGSPFSTICNGKVVGIHSSFDEENKVNYAVPINLNGNDIYQFEGVLRHMKDRRVKLPNTTSYLGEDTCEVYRKEKVSLFGQRNASQSTASQPVTDDEVLLPAARLA
ncbi:hypothetical protein F5Y10DRAFT_258921 [Nemania abortiva]|nr:hypothetical protein F5Y10DRAFT_258921 [Nemania abortiva]